MHPALAVTHSPILVKRTEVFRVGGFEEWAGAYTRLFFSSTWPFSTDYTRRVPPKALTLRRKVNECKPLGVGLLPGRPVERNRGHGASHAALAQRWLAGRAAARDPRRGQPAGGEVQDASIKTRVKPPLVSALEATIW